MSAEPTAAGHEHGEEGSGASESPGGAGAASISPGAAWDKRYAAMDWPSHPDETLVALVRDLPAGRALDLACGPGRNAIWLASRGWQVTGVDASAVGLAQAAERARAAGVSLELVQADVLHYEPLGAFDLVVVANLHFGSGEREGFFARAGACLAPGGHLYVVGHHLESLGRAGPPDPDRLYTEARLEQLLAPMRVRVWRHERSVDGEKPPLVDVVAWATVPSSGGESP